MAKNINKFCHACKLPFLGRKDAKTCSSRCRKRLQRAKLFLSTEAEKVRDSFAGAVYELEHSLAHVPVPVPVYAAESYPESITVSTSGEGGGNDFSSSHLGNNGDKPPKNKDSLFARLTVVALCLLFLLIGAIMALSSSLQQPVGPPTSGDYIATQNNDSRFSDINNQLDDLRLKVAEVKPQQILVEKGQPGPEGLNGAVGSAGEAGAAGTSGIDGSNGINGTDGATGPVGPQGPLGVASCPNGPCLSRQATSPGVQEVGNINISGRLIAAELQGDGSDVTSVDALSLQGFGAGYFTNAGNISSGTLADSRLSSNVALLNGTGPQVFSGDNRFNGTFLAQNAVNSTTAFQIQNAAGTSNLFNADTANNRIGIGTAVPGYTLDVAGDINSSTALRVGGTAVCTSSGCTAAGGSANYIRNGTSLQAANFNIQSTALGTPAATIRAATGGTTSGEIVIQSLDGGGTATFTVAADGTVIGNGSATFSNGTVTGSSVSANNTVTARVSKLGQVKIGTDNTTPIITFGSAEDTNLYRSAADTLKTDDSLIAATVAANGTITSSTALFVQNPTNTLADLRLDFSSDIARIRLGGSGAGSANGLQIQGIGNDIKLGISDAGQLSLPKTGSSAGILMGGDTNLYRSAADTLKTDDSLTVAGVLTSNSSALFQNSSNSTTAFQIQNVAGTSNLFNADTTNTRIGIGTAAPSYLLDVQGGTGIVAQFSGRVIGANAVSVNEFTTKGQLDALTSGTAGAFIQGGNSFGATAILGTNDANSLAFETGGNTQGTIANGGATTFKNSTNSTTAFQIQNAAGTSNLFVADTTNTRIGIGTTPTLSTAQLQISGNTISNNIFIGDIGYGVFGYYGIAHSSQATTTGYALVQSALGETVLNSATSQALRFRIGDSEKMTITSSGDVGIGTSSPTARLSVYKATNSSLSVLSGGGGGNTATIEFGPWAGRPGGAANRFVSIDDANFSAHYTIWTAPPGSTGNTAAVERFRITSSGNVGIGTTAIASLLQVGTNTTNAAGGITFGTDTNLYRSAANNLKTDDLLDLSGVAQTAASTGGGIGDKLALYNNTYGFGIQSSTLVAYTGGGFAVRTVSATGAKSSGVDGVRLDGGGQITSIGTGKTALQLTSTAADTGLTLGGDTNLYRSAANTLKTDDSFIIQTAANSTAAFQIQNAAATALLNADTTGMVITIGGTNTNFATLHIEDAHFKSTQTTAPTVATPASCGTTPSAAVTAASTDSAGSFTITAGTGSPASCDTTVTFKTAYGAAPKSIMVTPAVIGASSANASARQVYVSATAAGTFTVKLNSAPAAGEVDGFYYWVVE